MYVFDPLVHSTVTSAAIPLLHAFAHRKCLDVFCFVCGCVGFRVIFRVYPRVVLNRFCAQVWFFGMCVCARGLGQSGVWGVDSFGVHHDLGVQVWRCSGCACGVESPLCAE